MKSKKDIRKIKKEHKRLEKDKKARYHSDFKERGSHMLWLINEVIDKALESNNYTSDGKEISITKLSSKSEPGTLTTEIDNRDIYYELDYLYTLTVYLELPIDYRLYNSIKLKYKDVKYKVNHLEKVGDLIRMELKVKNDERNINNITLSINDHMFINLK